MNESIACRRQTTNAQIERHLTDSILAELGHTNMDITTNSWWNPVDAFQQHVLNPLNGQGNAPPRGSVPPPGSVPPARNPQPLNQNRGPAIPPNSRWNPVAAFQQHVLNPLNGQGNAPPRGSVPPPGSVPQARNPQPLDQNRGPAISPAQLKAQERAARDAKVRAQGAAANNKNHIQVGINNQKAAEEAKRLRALQIWYQTDDSKTGGLSVAQKMQKQREMSQFSGGPRRK
jgi:hypothetical protein